MENRNQKLSTEPAESLVSQEHGSLLPCPFCDGGAEVYPEESNAGYYVACFQPRWPVTECFCALGEEYDRDAMPEHRFKTKAEAIAAWNTRAKKRRSIK